MPRLPPFSPHEVTGLMASRRGATTTLSFEGPGGRTATHVHTHASEADAITALSLLAQYVDIVFRQPQRAA